MLKKGRGITVESPVTQMASVSYALHFSAPNLLNLEMQ